MQFDVKGESLNAQRNQEDQSEGRREGKEVVAATLAR